MKIIGKTENNFLVEASDSELAQLCGYSGTYYMPNRGEIIIRPGMTIEVTKMFAALNELSLHYNKVVAAQASLRAAADALNFPMPVLGEMSDKIEEYRPSEKT